MLEHLEQLTDDLQLQITAEMISESADFEVDECCTYVRKEKAKVGFERLSRRFSQRTAPSP